MLRIIAVLALVAPVAAAGRPNVVLVMTDDQGYGDLSCHGNPVLKTPNIDKLHAQSARLTDFHVAPMCTPTRGQLLTGRDALRNGASAVCAGRAFVRPGVPLLPEMLRAARYKTGLFGKWHLGDSYPNRPNDKGFDEAVYHQGWGVTSVADSWNNDYSDGTWLHNGAPRKYPGYCTDVFFGEAIQWMGERADRKEPFFCYLPTNAPHGPLWCPEAWKRPFAGTGGPPAFFGMIANIDANVGKLLAFLDERKLADDTIVIYLHDNGGTAGVKFFNAGLRASKTTYYDGGHRSPCFVRWPGNKNLKAGDFDRLTVVQDITPTLLTWCGAKPPEGAVFDGANLGNALAGEGWGLLELRAKVVQYGESPGGSKLEKFNCCVMQNAVGKRWRLVHGTELYDLTADPGQTTDIAAKHPYVVKALREHYEKWWADVEPNVNDYVPIVLGSDQQNPVPLTSADWSGTYADNVPRDVRGGLNKNGPWHVKIERDGEYEIRLRRWPAEANAAMTAGVPEFRAKDGGVLAAGKALPVAQARLTIGGFDETKPVAATDQEAVFMVPLKASAKLQLKSYLLDATGRELCGAFYASVRRK